MPSNLQPVSSSIDFGSVVTGMTAGVTFGLTNTGGSQAATITSISIDNSDFTASVSTPFEVPADFAATTFDLQFTAGTPGLSTGTMTIVSDDPGSPMLIPLSGTSVAVGVKAISISPSSFMFANTKAGEDSAIQVFVVTNTGTVDVDIISATFPTGFVAAVPIPAYTVTLAPGDTTSIGCTFSPSGQGYVSGNLEIESDIAGTPSLIPLSGIGFLITPAYIVTGSTVVLAAFGNTVLQFDALDLDCEEDAFVTRDVNLTMPGLEDSMLQMQLNHEAKGTSALTMTIENQRGQAPTAAIALSAETNDKIRAAFGNLNTSLTGEVLTVTLTHDADGGPVSITGYILRHVPAGEVKP